jgi:hypothetical protein
MELIHESLTALVHTRGGHGSTLKGQTSSHILPRSVPFQTLRNIVTIVGGSGRSGEPRTALFLGTRDKELVLSARPGSTKRKRGQDDSEEQYDVDRKLSDVTGSIEELNEMRRVICSLNRLKGASDEPALQSLTIQRRQLGKDSSDALVVAARMHAGVAISLHALQSALGSGWKNGAITTEASFDGLTLPALSVEGRVSEETGNASWVVVSAIDTSVTPA